MKDIAQQFTHPKLWGLHPKLFNSGLMTYHCKGHIPGCTPRCGSHRGGWDRILGIRIQEWFLINFLFSKNQITAE